MQEWLSGKSKYITSCASRFRWLVSYNGVDGEKILDSWKGWLDDHSDSCTPVSDENSNSTKFLKKFGLIPGFKRAYEIIYSKETSCLSCSCGMWNRTKLPCRHLAAIINNTDFLKNLYPHGFPYDLSPRSD